MTGLLAVLWVTDALSREGDCRLFVITFQVRHNDESCGRQSWYHCASQVELKRGNGCTGFVQKGQVTALVARQAGFGSGDTQGCCVCHVLSFTLNAHCEYHL